MKTHISNKQLSSTGYENKIINNIDRGIKQVKDEPFNTAIADALKEALKKKMPVKKGLVENRVTWNTLTLTND